MQLEADLRHWMGHGKKATGTLQYLTMLPRLPCIGDYGTDERAHVAALQEFFNGLLPLLDASWENRALRVLARTGEWQDTSWATRLAEAHKRFPENTVRSRGTSALDKFVTRKLVPILAERVIERAGGPEAWDDDRPDGDSAGEERGSTGDDEAASVSALSKGDAHATPQRPGARRRLLYVLVGAAIIVSVAVAGLALVASPVHKSGSEGSKTTFSDDAQGIPGDSSDPASGTKQADASLKDSETVEAEIQSASIAPEPQAIAAYEKLIREHPGSSRARYALSSLHLQSGELSQALQVADEALNVDASDPSMLRLRSRIRLAIAYDANPSDARDVRSDALKDARAALSQDDSVASTLAVAEVYIDQGNLEQAQTRLDTAAAQGSDPIELTYAQARLDSVAGRPSAALAVLEKVEPQHSDDPELFRLKAAVLATQDPNKAVDAIQIAIDLSHPAWYVDYLSLGDFEWTLAEPRASLAAYRAALRLSPRDCRAWRGQWVVRRRLPSEGS